MQKKTVTIVTATRAEYGILRTLIFKLLKSEQLEVKLVVTGAHLSAEFGLTYQEIERDGLKIDAKIPILMGSDTPASISKTMGLAMIGFGDFFEANHTDLLILLGDRYEMLAVASAALNARIPIAHLHGGETTQGAVDEAYRHAITKMSFLHFTSTEDHRKRVIQLGEQPSRVFNVGALGVENALNTEFMSRKELGDSVGMDLECPFAIVTFHPVTLENGSAEKQTDALLSALNAEGDLCYIITGANADAGGQIINQKLREFVEKHKNSIYVPSLGLKRYMSALHYASLVIGNSSSGIIEVPSFGIPTVNIGDRQKGRTQSTSVINCSPDRDSITTAIQIARSEKFIQCAKNTQNPYGDGNVSNRIVKIITGILENNIELKKEFYDIALS